MAIQVDNSVGNNGQGSSITLATLTPANSNRYLIVAIGYTAGTMMKVEVSN
jgi:hypothetical protein